MGSGDRECNATGSLALVEIPEGGGMEVFREWKTLLLWERGRTAMPKNVSAYIKTSGFGQVAAFLRNYGCMDQRL